MIGKNVPVMGYRDKKYDVYIAKVVQYNTGKENQYLSLENNFAKVTEGTNGYGGSATFQFNNYDDALREYENLLTIYIIKMGRLKKAI